MRNSRLLITLLVVLLLSGCTERTERNAGVGERERVSGVRVETVGLSQVDEYYDTSGTVKARTVSNVASRVMGTVTSVRVKEGDRVTAGQLLMTIDDSDVAQKLRAAQEGYTEAGKALEAAGENRRLLDITYQRYKKLYEEKALSGQEYDQIKTQKRVADIDYERAEAAVSRAEAGLSEMKVYHLFTRVVSPVTGIVTEKKVDPGCMAVPGVPLVTVEDNSSYHVEINVNERLAGKIRPGTEVDVFIHSQNRLFKGTVTEVVPSVDPASRSSLAKISVKAEGLRNGFYGKVSIPIGKKEALLVPKEALVEKGELTGVYVVDDHSVITYRLVRPGRVFGGRVEILTGLNPKERLIVDGAERAVDGGLAVTNGEK